MFNYFDKAFFRIIGGFVAILCVSLLVFLFAGYLQARENRMPPAPSSGLTAGQAVQGE